MEGYLCDNCEEYTYMPKNMEGKECSLCGDWVWNLDFQGVYEEGSDEASVANYMKQEEPAGKYRPQYNELGEINY